MIQNINERTTKYTIACSLLRCYVQQYVNILNLKFKNRSNIFLTGGIAKNIPTIKRLFEYYLNESVTVEDNDTLKGLYKYSKYDDTRFWFNR
jgi:activator of 2-hydroxyglutaryl-CoA dehydratase